MSKDFDFEKRFYVNKDGKKVTGAAYDTHLIKEYGGLNKLMKDVHNLGYMKGVVDTLLMLKNTNKRGR